MEGSGVSLPLDLHAIASKLNGSFYAPRRFAAVQLAFQCPRARVLIFHTGRLVGTGTESPTAARHAIARAQRTLATEAGVKLWVRKFAVINTVGAASLNATLNCESFASANRATSHYDRASFVGMAWRPPNKKICCGTPTHPLLCHRFDPIHSNTHCRIRCVRVLAQRSTQPDVPSAPILKTKRPCACLRRPCGVCTVFRGPWPSATCRSRGSACCPSCCATPRPRGFLRTSRTRWTRPRPRCASGRTGRPKRHRPLPKTIFRAKIGTETLSTTRRLGG